MTSPSRSWTASPFWKGSTLKGKNLLPILSSYSRPFFQMEHKTALTELLSQWNLCKKATFETDFK